jgi:hypothetical protein
MKLTLLAYLPSAALVAYSILQSQTHNGARETQAGLVLAELLAMPATFVVALYWLVRLVRYAWRDQSQPVPEPSPSGRIFGPLQ